ncbi:MAG: hypothetical protein R3E95_11290 [Thiolinea sp.]
MILDSNILIYSVTPDYKTLLSPYVNDPENSVSLVSKLEVLGFHRLTEEDEQRFEKYFPRLTTFPIHTDLVDTAIRLRQQKIYQLAMQSSLQLHLYMDSRCAHVIPVTSSGLTDWS